MKRIIITIAPDGETEVETSGFAGPECLDASKFLEDALGERQSEKLTSEFYASSSEQLEIRQDEREGT